MSRRSVRPLSEAPEVMRVDDLALYLPVSRFTIYRLVGSGVIRSTKAGTAQKSPILIRREDVQHWLAGEKK
jgi:excisionase family DNA binding protein